MGEVRSPVSGVLCAREPQMEDVQLFTFRSVKGFNIPQLSSLQMWHILQHKFQTGAHKDLLEMSQSLPVATHGTIAFPMSWTQLPSVSLQPACLTTDKRHEL